MRKLTGALFQSLDGVMQAPGAPEEDPSSDFRFGGWVQPFWSEQMGPFERVIDADYDLLLGKRTYDIFAAYWPYNQDNPQRSLHHPQALSWPPLLTIAFQ